MAKEQDWINLGEEILDSVADALNTGDFRNLNNRISGTVNTVVQEAKRQADAERLAREESLLRYQQNVAMNQEKWMKQQAELRQRQEQRREEWRKIREAQMKGRQQAIMNNAQGVASMQRSNAAPIVSRVKFKPVGSVASVLYTVFGAIGLGVGASFLFVTLILLASGGTALPFGIVSLLALSVSTAFLRTGGKIRRMIKRAKRYIQICGQKKYANISELASMTGKNNRFVIKDLKKMLEKGMFLEGHLDEQETCLMLSDDVYRQYTATSQAFKMREQETATVAQELDEKQKQEAELNTMFTEGMEYIRKLRELNDAIPGEEITNQLSQLEGLLKQIFDRVKEHPEQMHRMHKLMDYYLPTTIKLVEAYVQFEKVETPGQDIQGAKAEILKTLGIINEAFTELLNNLFQDEVFDATTDAQVLQTMLSREGLRREMTSQPAENVQDEVESEEEEQGITLTMEPEQPELQILKAPWES